MNADIVDFTVSTRPLYQVFAALLLLCLCFPQSRAWLDKLVRSVDQPGQPKRVIMLLSLSSVVAFFLALVSKYSQLRSHLLYGSDFWLFADMLHWMSIGEGVITRFLYFDLGAIQHGALHSFLSMYFLVPLTWVFGSATTAILMNPLAFALAGFAVGFVAYRWTHSAFVTFVAVTCVWMSNWINRMLQYECHPETFYVFLIVMAAYLMDRKRLITKRTWFAFVIVWLALAGMKQDALVVGGLLCVWGLIEKRVALRTAVLQLGILVVVVGSMTLMISKFGDRKIGPTHITIGTQSEVPVEIVNRGSVIVGSKKLSGVESLKAVVETQIENHGGIGKLIFDAVSYPFVPPFLVLILVAPWVLLRRDFWILVFPLALLFGVFRGPMSELNAYYSVTAVGLLFVCILRDFALSTEQQFKFRMAKLVWIFCFSAIHGSSGLHYYQPSSLSVETDREAERIAQDLTGLGIVSSSLLRVVDHDKVWSDHTQASDPIGRDLPAYVGWVLYPKFFESWDFKATRFSEWKSGALASGEWELIPGKTVDLLRRKSSASSL
jgi:uncharacterized membrane protein